MQTLEIRQSEESDVKTIMEIIVSAKRFLREHGVDQWQDAQYPSPEIIRADIATGESWVAELNQHVVGTMYLSFDGEPTYNRICDGKWLTPHDARYGVIHRLAVSDSARGAGIAKQLINFAINDAENLGMTSIRVDTHADNTVMQTLMRQIGFSLCGVIYLANGDSRLAFEFCL